MPSSDSTDISLSSVIWGSVFGFWFFWVLIKQSVLDRDKAYLKGYYDALRERDSDSDCC